MEGKSNFFEAPETTGRRLDLTDCEPRILRQIYAEIWTDCGTCRYCAYYLREESYVFTHVCLSGCLSVCLAVNRITRKLPIKTL